MQGCSDIEALKSFQFYATIPTFKRLTFPNFVFPDLFVTPDTNGIDNQLLCTLYKRNNDVWRNHTFDGT